MSGWSDGGRRAEDGPHRARCAHEDRVVALLVDGDVSGVVEDAAALLEHLADCGDCERAVAAARRIDALVAESKPHPEVAAVEAWLTAAVAERGDSDGADAGLPVVARASLAPSAVGPSAVGPSAVGPSAVGPSAVGAGSRSDRVAGLALAGLAASAVLGVAAWLMLRAGADDRLRGAPPTMPYVRVAAEDVQSAGDRPDRVPGGHSRERVAELRDPGQVREAAVPPIRDPAPTGSATIVLFDRDPVQLRGHSFGGGREAFGASTERQSPKRQSPKRPSPERLEAVARWPGLELLELSWNGLLGLTRGVSPGEAGAWRQLAASTVFGEATLPRKVQMLGAVDRDPLPGLVVDLARADRELRSSLWRRLRGEPSYTELVAAARLSVEEFDTELFAVAARQHRTRWPVVVDALRQARERDDRGAMLLALATQSLGRGRPAAEGLRGELVIVRRVFAGLGPEVAAQLLRRLPELRRADARRLTLLALGELADPGCSTVLTGVLLGPRLEEAELATWALGRIAAGSDRLAALRPPRRRVALWRTALASRRDPHVARWVDAMTLTAAERELLLAGDFSPRQCVIVARLFADLDPRQVR